MSLIQKLSICGVRSFGPYGEENITFSTPLTLILGQNGCGKTTIIECLKFALTGVLPAGTGTGSGFINDPKLSNKQATKGAIKVRFRDCKGDYITVAKFAEVTISKDTLKFKSINPSIRWEDGITGRIQDIGGRCVDLNSYCLQKLNVPKAILEHVIFCHQENSAWPLEEGKKLKERFDEIFGAEMYNKTVEKLRSIIADKKKALKTLEEQLKLKIRIHEGAQKFKDDLKSNREELWEVQEVINQKKNELEPLQTRLDKILATETELTELNQKLVGLNKMFEANSKRQENLKLDIKEEFQGTDEDLANEILDFDKNQEDTGKSISEMEAKQKTIENGFRKIQEEIHTLQMDLAKLKAEEENITKIQHDLSELMEKTKIKLNVSSQGGESTIETIDRLKTAMETAESNWNKNKAEKEAKEKKIQREVNRIRDNYAAEKMRLKTKEETKEDHQRTIDSLRIKRSRFLRSNEDIAEIDSQIQKIERKIDDLKSGFDENKICLEIEEIEQQIIMKENRLNTLEKDYKVLQDNYVTEQSIEKEKKIINEKKTEIEQIHQQNDSNFKLVFGNELPKNNYESLLTKLNKTQELKLKDIDKNIYNLEKKVSKSEENVKHTKEKIQVSRKDLEIKTEKTESMCGNDEFSDVLNRSHTKKEKLIKDRGAYRSAKTLYDEFIASFKVDTPCCPICETNFSSNQSRVTTIIKTLESKIQEIPSKLNCIEADLKKEEQVFNKLQQLKPINEEMHKLKNTIIPELRNALEEKQESLNEDKKKLASLKEEKKNPERFLAVSRMINRDVVLLDRLIRELAESEINLQTFHLVQVPSNRSLKEVETEINLLKTELSDLRRQQKCKKTASDNFRETYNKRQVEWQTATQKKLQLQAALQEKPQLESHIEEYKQKIEIVDTEITECQENIDQLTVEVADVQCTQEEMVSANKSEVEDGRKKLEESRYLLNEIYKKHDQIVKYEESGRKATLAATEAKLIDRNAKITKIQDAIKAFDTKLAGKKNEQVVQESRFRYLKDTKEFRENEKENQQLQKKISDLKTIIAKKSVMADKQMIINEINEITKVIFVKTGKQDNLKENVKKIERELNTKENREASHEYKKKEYEVRVEKLAFFDLENYVYVLENSILKFHQEKMAHINLTIRDLWRNIYKGNDIDYIEIQTDGNVGKGGGRRRSYNYKVVQVKKGVALEMRGRCSAGQKVLACLVIRIALAETFSANCGILALDEPTTNLDRENIDSLCDALSKIISTRQQHSTFQLIIITHDEEFLQTLIRNQSTSHFYRVTRNADGFSVLKKENL